MKRSTPLDRNIGAKVKYYRKLRGLSQKQLAAAEALKVDYNALFAQD